MAKDGVSMRVYDFAAILVGLSPSRPEYVGLTLAQIVLLYVLTSMPLFEAVCYSLATVSTGAPLSSEVRSGSVEMIGPSTPR